MPDPIVVDAPDAAGLADASLDGLSDLDFLDATIAKSLESTDIPPKETDSGDVEEPVVEPVAQPEKKDVKPAEPEAKPDKDPADKQEADKVEEPEHDDGSEGVSIKKLTDLAKASPEFKALLDKNPGLRNQLFVTARRAERSGQYDELFQTPALAKEAKNAADDAFFTRGLYEGKTPEDSDKFWRKLQWDDLVKDEKGQPKIDPQTGQYQTYGSYDHHTSHYRMAVYQQAERLAGQLQASGQTFRDAGGNEVSADDLLVAVQILRAVTNGVPLPASGQPAQAAEGAPAPKAPVAQQQVPPNVQKELDELRARDRQRQQTETKTAEEFKTDVEAQRLSAVQTDIKNLLAKRLPANVGITEYMREMMVRDTANEIYRLSRSNMAHQSQIKRALSAAPKTADGAKSVVAIEQAFAKEMIPRILAGVIKKAVPGITAANTGAQQKVKAQAQRREVASSGGVSTPSRPDAKAAAAKIMADAKKAGREVSDMDLLDGVMNEVHGR
jgi:hypothetical protein